MAGEKILVVDDNEQSLELIHDILEAHGYLVYKATSGEEALKLVKEDRPDLILMDIQLPVMDGVTATRKIKEDPANRDIPVLAITAYALRGDEEKIITAGFNGYISKPISTKELPKTVAAALKRKTL